MFRFLGLPIRDLMAGLSSWLAVIGTGQPRPVAAVLAP